MTLNNAMLDSRESHNLMPKVVMDQLGLDITRHYKDMFSFDLRKVMCLGLIKDQASTTSQTIRQCCESCDCSSIPSTYEILGLPDSERDSTQLLL
jgi:hypothetical protein